MGFKMNGSPAKLGSISGTSGHSSALKMKAEANAAEAAAAEAGSSPAKYAPLLPVLYNAGRVAVTRAVPHIIKQAPKITNTLKKIIPVIPRSSFGTGFGGAKTVTNIIKKGWNKTPGWVKATGAYFGIDAVIDKMTGSGNNKGGGKSSGSKVAKAGANLVKKTKTSSGDSWTKAVNKNKSTGGGVTLNEYIKIRNSNPKGSSKYASAQNKINEAYGSSTRHSGGSSSSSSSASSASSGTTKTRKRLGGGTTKVTKSDGKKVKVKYDRHGKVKKTITKGGGRRTVTDSEGNIIRSRKTRNKKWD